MNITKKAGRPRSFKLEDALMAAVQVFWAKGYEGASIKDLTNAMGINAPDFSRHLLEDKQFRENIR